NAVKGANLQSSVVGIGLNVFQETFAAHLPNPASLVQFIQPPALDVLLQQLCAFLDAAYSQLRRGELNQLKQEYEHALLGIGQWLNFESEGHVFNAQVTGVNERGQLCLRKQSQEELMFEFKQVTWKF